MGESGLTACARGLTPGLGLKRDFRLRWPLYRSDWQVVGREGALRVVAAATYIFFASCIPAIAFGEQLRYDTKGLYSTVETLAATGLMGILQALCGGQPLLIVGVAEPIVIIYAFMFEYATREGIPFLAWSAWTCVWASAMLFLLAAFNACALVSYFSRYSGEMFGMLIAVLFLQQAVKGLIQEFQIGIDSVPEGQAAAWRMVNGVFSVLLSLGFIFCCMLLTGARKWRFLLGWVRALLADYGTPLMMVVFSGVSYVLRASPAPPEIPERLQIPDALDSTWLTRGYKVTAEMGGVPTEHVFSALVPAFIITVLFYFDHSVSSKLAQQPDIGVKKPSAYHWDCMLIAVMTLVCGLIGLPPVNGVLPQAPLHTKALVAKSSKSKKVKGSDVNLVELGHSGGPTPPEPASDADTCAGDMLERSLSAALPPLSVYEQRWSGLLQSVAVLVVAFLAPVLRLIPTSLLWGFFAVMAIESLPGSQFWDRLTMLFTDPRKRYRMLENEHCVYLETVPYPTVILFTLIQFAVMAGTWGITWAGIAGIAFPIVIMATVPFRSFVLPKIFKPEHLDDLDAPEVETTDAVGESDYAAEGLDEFYARPGPQPDSVRELKERLEEELSGPVFNVQLHHHVGRDAVRRRATGNGTDD